jgi:hypothetical protein
MELLKTLNNINTMIEATLVIELTDEDFADGREEIEHIYFHEACHAAISHCVPWIHTLDEEEHTAVDEIMARFLELEIGQSFGMPVHTSQEHVDELRTGGISKISPWISRTFSKGAVTHSRAGKRD